MKNLFKKSIASLLAMTMVLSLAPTVAFAEDATTVTSDLKTEITNQTGSVTLNGNIDSWSNTSTITHNMTIDGDNQYYIDGDDLPRYGIGFKSLETQKF